MVGAPMAGGWGAQHRLKQLLGIEDSRLPRSGQDWLKTQDDGDKRGTPQKT